MECQQEIATLAAEVQERQADAALFEADATLYYAEIDMAKQFGVAVDPEIVARQTAARHRLSISAGRLIESAQGLLDYQTVRMNTALERCDNSGPRRKLGFFTIKKTCRGQ